MQVAYIRILKVTIKFKVYRYDSITLVGGLSKVEVLKLAI